MNLEQARELFFSQYWGQPLEWLGNYDFKSNPIYYYDRVVGGDLFYFSGKGMAFDIDSCKVILRGIDQLTDAEYITAAKLQSSILELEKWEIKVTRNLKEPIRVWGFWGDDCINITVNEWAANVLSIDYLRSIGTLLPFTYLNTENKPTTLSAAEILELGWAQIKTN